MNQNKKLKVSEIAEEIEKNICINMRGKSRMKLVRLALGISHKELVVTLSENGFNFFRLLDELRIHVIAKTILKDPSISLKKMARVTGLNSDYYVSALIKKNRGFRWSTFKKKVIMSELSVHRNKYLDFNFDLPEPTVENMSQILG